MEFKHISVLLNETIECMMVRSDGVYLDGTLGGAGHSSLIASKLETGHLYGVDQDSDAIAAASERLKPYEKNVTVIRDNYRNAVRILKEMGVSGADGETHQGTFDISYLSSMPNMTVLSPKDAQELREMLHREHSRTQILPMTMLLTVISRKSN